MKSKISVGDCVVGGVLCLSFVATSCSSTSVAHERKEAENVKSAQQFPTDEIHSALAGKQLVRGPNSTTNTSREVFASDGRWIAFVEGSIRLRFEGTWHLERDGNSQAVICTKSVALHDPDRSEDSFCRHFILLADRAQILIEDFLVKKKGAGRPRNRFNIMGIEPISNQS